MTQDLAEVYRTTYRALVRFLYRKVWDAERAEDLAQDAARRAARERRHLTLLKSEPAVSPPPSDEAVHVASDRARVRVALEQLTPRDREALLLWDAGLSYEEIAAQTGLTRGAIGTTLARARRRLVEAFEAGKKGGNVARG